MSGRSGIVAAIVAKDLRAFARDRFYVVVSIVGMVFYVTIFWLLPATVDETVPIGIHLGDLAALGDATATNDPADLGVDGLLDGGLADVFGGLAGAGDEAIAGIEVALFGSAQALEAAVLAGDEVVAGIDLPAGLLTDPGQPRPTVRVLLPADAPDELRPTLTALVRELAFGLTDAPPPAQLPAIDEVVVGTDRIGAQISLREQLRPLLVFFVLLVEMFALASLVAMELQQRTITAVLVSPARIGDVLAAKTLLGTLLAFSQAMLLLAATGAVGADRVTGSAGAQGLAVLVVALLIGSVLVSSIALISGSFGRDFIGIVFFSTLFMIPLAVPAFAVLFPGSPAAWIQALPTHGLVSVIVGVTVDGDGLRGSAADLGLLLAWCVAAFAIGVQVLRRRVARL